MSEQDQETLLEDLFDQADQLLFVESKHDEAYQIYQRILTIDNNNVDAINSLAYCVKFKAQGDVNSQVFEELLQLHKRTLQIDPSDIEGNFNLGLLYLQSSEKSNFDLETALKHFKLSVEKDKPNNGRLELFRAQFAKAYYNIGMIHDRLGKIQEAADSYKQVLITCENDPNQKLLQSSTHKKAGTNLAVALEKLGKRDEAVLLLQDLQSKFGNEVRLFNNLGIIYKRKGEVQAAINSYKSALKTDPYSFFPNYNLAVVLAGESQYKEAIDYLKIALQLTQVDNSPDVVYQTNVLINLSICYEQLKQFQQAAKFLEQAGAISPNNEQIIKKISVLQEMVNDPINESTQSVHSQGAIKDKLKIDLARSAKSSARNQPIRSAKSLQQSQSKLSQTQSQVDIMEVQNQLESIRNQVAQSPSSISVAPDLADQEALNDIDDSPREKLNESRASEIEQRLNDSVTSLSVYLSWDRDEAKSKLTSNNQSDVVRAWYRLGQLDQEEGKNETSLNAYKQARLLDPTFQTELVNLRIAETAYKLQFYEVALDALGICEKSMREQDKNVIYLLKGKCYDKKRHYNWAVEEYDKALILSKQFQLPDLVVGSIMFRLGWSRLRSKRNIEQGINQMKQALRLCPDNVEILQKLSGALFSEMKQSKECDDDILSYLERICQMQKTNCFEAQLLKGKTFYRAENILAAVECFNEACEQPTKDESQRATCQNFLGLCHEKLQNFKEAMICFKKCLQIDSSHFNACIHLAKILANSGENVRAMKYFKHASKIDPDSISALFGLAKATQLSVNDKSEAIVHYQEVIRREPNHYQAYTQMGILHLDREEFDKAAVSIRQALTINKTYPLALAIMGNILFQSGNPEQSIKYYTQALKFEKADLQSLVGLGNAHYQLEQVEQAVNFYKMAIAVDDHQADVHYNLGNSLYLIQDIEDAIVHYNRAITLNPNKAESHYNLGNALCVQAEYEKAVAAYGKSLRIDQQNAQAYYNLGNALYMLNKFQEAIEAYQKSLNINSKSAECYFNLASAYNDTFDYKQATKYYKDSLKHDSNNIDTYFCLAQAQEADKKFGKAILTMQDLLKLEPENEKAKEMLYSLKSKLTAEQKDQKGEKE